MNVKNKRYKKRPKGNKFISLLVAIILLCTCALIAFTAFSALRPAPEKQPAEEDKTVQVSSVESVPEPEFVNTYAPLDTQLTLEATKVLEGRTLEAGRYSFEVVSKRSAFSMFFVSISKCPIISKSAYSGRRARSS